MNVQEAHHMVTAANTRAATAEKSLKEAKMAVDVLTGEVTALKAMVCMKKSNYALFIT